MSAQYKKIMVPIDGSEHAGLACCHAVGLAAGGGSEIVLAHCYGELPDIIGGVGRKEIIADAEAEAKALLEPCEARCKDAGVPYKLLVFSGNPGRAIVQAARNEQCDLIAMGSRGLGGFAGIVMGSVSRRVLEYASIPVLIVR